MYSAFGQQEVSIIYTQLNQYYVVLEVAPQFYQTPEGLKYIYLNSAGKKHSDKSVTRGKTHNIPLSVNHTGLFPSVTVSFNLARAWR